MPFDSHALKRQPQALSSESSQAERPIRCCACGAAVTSGRHRTQRGGGHEHRLVNPAGLCFHVGCFTAAPGCRSQGEARFEHTWFAGYAWQVAACAGCGRQLGWSYGGIGDPFFGLILDRLRESE